MYYKYNKRLRLAIHFDETRTTFIRALCLNCMILLTLTKTTGDK